MVQYGKKGDEVRDPKFDPFMFNIKAEERRLIELAARNTGVDIEIREEAVSQQGTPLSGYIGVFSKEPLGPQHMKFLDEYRRLVKVEKNKKNWR